MTWCPEALAAFLVRVPGVAPGPQGTAACFHQLHRDCLPYSVFITKTGLESPRLSEAGDEKPAALRQSMLDNCRQF